MPLSRSSSVTSPGPMILMPALSRPRLDELLDEDAALAGRHEDEDRIGLLVGGALQERREVGIGQREGDAVEQSGRPSR